MEYIQTPEFKQVQEQLNNNNELLDELLSIFKLFKQHEYQNMSIAFHPILNSANNIMSLEYKINVKSRTVDTKLLSQHFKIVFMTLNTSKNIDIFVESNKF